ncbi:hypothetical protein BDZ45DRAFT_26639 [Acephala macrosclerotiorum]|nr:hypothetical protein BDZ45DRAFT_26639 [Acephala macrosclerotiorum]
MGTSSERRAASFRPLFTPMFEQAGGVCEPFLSPSRIPRADIMRYGCAEALLFPETAIKSVDDPRIPVLFVYTCICYMTRCQSCIKLGHLLALGSTNHSGWITIVCIGIISHVLLFVDLRLNSKFVQSRSSAEGRVDVSDTDIETVCALEPNIVNRGSSIYLAFYPTKRRFSERA